MTIRNIFHSILFCTPPCLSGAWNSFERIPCPDDTVRAGVSYSLNSHVVEPLSLMCTQLNSNRCKSTFTDNSQLAYTWVKRQSNLRVLPRQIYTVKTLNLFAVDENRLQQCCAAPTDLIVDWIEQRYSQNEAGNKHPLVTGSKFMQQGTMWRTIAKHEFMHEFMFRYCPSHCSLLHKFTSGYHNDACFGFIFDAKTGTLLLYPVYYEISGCTPWTMLSTTCCNIVKHNKL